MKRTRTSITSLMAVPLMLLAGMNLHAQNGTTLPEFDLEKVDVEAHVRILASDVMNGRMTGTPGNDQAAGYIAGSYAAYGLKSVPGQKGYYQYVYLQKVAPATSGTLVIGSNTFSADDGLILFANEKADLSAPVVFAGHGWVDSETGHNDYEGLDVKGKIVVVLPGSPGSSDSRNAFRTMVGGQKQAEAAAHGAVGLIELARFRIQWPMFRQATGRPMTSPVSAEKELPESFFYGWLNEGDADILTLLKKNSGEVAKLNTPGNPKTVIRSQNVAGFVEGVDPALKDEVIILSAHYDHVGGGANAAGGGMTPEDSIFNGARDNALGVAALLSAARSLSKRPPKRSVMFLAFTGEEMGLLGSKYYAENPLIPLKQTMYNLNCDGAGFNEKTMVTVLGFERTNMDAYVEEGVKPFGLELLINPMPEQNLYDRSDNVSFSKKGVPSLTFSPGISAFDEEIGKYYHQVADEADGIDYGYVLRFCQAFTHTARAMADASETPAWLPGDPYGEIER